MKREDTMSYCCVTSYSSDLLIMLASLPVTRSMPGRVKCDQLWPVFPSWLWITPVELQTLLDVVDISLVIHEDVTWVGLASAGHALTGLPREPRSSKEQGLL